LWAEIREERVEAREVASNADGVDAEIYCAEEGSHGASAGATEGSDAIWVDLGARDEVVDGTNAIPDDDASRSVADEGGLETGFAVLASCGFEKGLGGIGGVGILEPLALADGVVG